MKASHKILVATLVVAGGAAAVTLPVLAQDAAPSQPQPQVQQVRFGDDHRGGRGMRGFGPGQLIRQFDTDQDGKLSAEEINAKLTAYDANKDGSLSIEEYQGLFAEVTNQIMVRTFQFLDRDGDAIVTGTEFSEPLEHAQERMADAGNHGPRGGRHDDEGRGQHGGGRHGDDDRGQRGGDWRPWR